MGNSNGGGGDSSMIIILMIGAAAICCSIIAAGFGLWWWSTQEDPGTPAPGGATPARFVSNPGDPYPEYACVTQLTINGKTENVLGRTNNDAKACLVTYGGKNHYPTEFNVLKPEGPYKWQKEAPAEAKKVKRGTNFDPSNRKTALCRVNVENKWWPGKVWDNQCYYSRSYAEQEQKSSDFQWAAYK